MQDDRYLCFLSLETVFFHTVIKFVTVMYLNISGKFVTVMYLNTLGKYQMGAKNVIMQIFKKIIICCYASNINYLNDWFSVMHIDEQKQK